MPFLKRNVDRGMHAIRLNLLENIMDAGFLCTNVYCLGKLEIISNLHVLCSRLNNKLFQERNVDMGMHAILDTM